MATALDNLALEETADRNIVADLIAINKKLVETNTPLVAQVKSLVATNALPVNPQGTASPNKPPSATNTRESFPLDPTWYCWSHGYKVRKGHNSRTCGRKQQGRQDDATLTNTFNGIMWNKPSA